MSNRKMSVNHKIRHVVRKMDVETDKSSLFLSATIFSFIFLVFASLQLFFTFFVPVGPTYSAKFVYLRNLSGVVGFLMLALFFYKWGDRKRYENHKNMNIFAIITLLTSLVCAGKAVATTLFLVVEVPAMNFVGIYYVIEIIAWAMLCIFFMRYFFRLVVKTPSKRHHNEVSSKKTAA